MPYKTIVRASGIKLVVFVPANAPTPLPSLQKIREIVSPQEKAKRERDIARLKESRDRQRAEGKAKL